MSKRFTDTDMWDKEWFMKLSCKRKCLVKLVRDKCDLSGVWSPNWIIAAAYIGEPVMEEELLMIDDGNQFLKLPNGKIFCIGFVNFQYGQLSEKSPVHRKILNLLKTHKIDYKYPINRVQEEEEEKEEAKETEEDEGVAGETTFRMTVQKQKVTDLNQFLKSNFSIMTDQLKMKVGPEKYLERVEAFLLRQNESFYQTNEDFRKHFNSFILMKIPDKPLEIKSNGKMANLLDTFNDVKYNPNGRNTNIRR